MKQQLLDCSATYWSASLTFTVKRFATYPIVIPIAASARILWLLLQEKVSCQNARLLLMVSAKKDLLLRLACTMLMTHSEACI